MPPHARFHSISPKWAFILWLLSMVLLSRSNNALIMRRGSIVDGSSSQRAPTGARLPVHSVSREKPRVNQQHQSWPWLGCRSCRPARAASCPRGAPRPRRWHTPCRLVAIARRAPPARAPCAASLERIRISFFENPPFCPSPQGETMGRGGQMRGITGWIWVQGRGTDLRYGHYKAAGRQRHLQADLPRSLGALPAAPTALPGAPRAGRHRQNARLWYRGGGLYNVSVPALPGRETRGVQLQEQLLPLLLQGVRG